MNSKRATARRHIIRSTGLAGGWKREIDRERAGCTMPVPRIFGISLRGALIVTTGRHSQLLCLLSWRGCADSPREKSTGWVVDAPGERAG